MVRRNLLFISISFIVLASNAANASTARRRTSVVRSSTTMKQSPVLEIRGGDIVKSNDAAKVATAVSLLQGAVSWLDPASALRGYGISTASSPFAELIMRHLGVILIQMGTIGACLFFNSNCSTQTALGAASLVSSVEIVRSILSKQHTTVGSGRLAPQLAILVQSLFVAYANLSNLKYSSMVNKINSICLMSLAIALAVAPESLTSAAWGVSNLDGKTIGMASGLGYWLFAYSVYIGALAWDMEKLVALVWNRVCILLIHFLPSKGEPIGVKKSKRTVLLVYQALILAGLVLKDGVRCLIRCSV